MSVLQIDSTITPVVNSATGAASASNAALPAVANKTNYLEGFDVTGGGPTTASVIAVTVTGLAGGTLTYYVALVAGALLNAISNAPVFSVRFPQPLEASAIDSAITVNVPSFGTGSSHQSCIAYGFYK